MAEKNNSTCSICGQEYYACLSCKDSVQLQPWKIYCCTADCYKVFQVVRGFSTGVYTKDEFKSKLQNVDLSNLENYKESIKALIKDALKENKPAVEEILTKEKPVVKAAISRKRNYKVNNETEVE